jgi:alkylated DNA repair dioxygenase AlkB
MPSPIDPDRLPPGFTHIDLGEGAWLGFCPTWLPLPGANTLLDALREGLAWASVTIVMLGRTVKQPRLTAWYGDEGASYTYSKRRFDPLPWTAELATLTARLRAETGHPWNGCLCNLYRDGHDAMGLHADRERELGPTPQVASLSLGATRRFILRSNRTKGLKRELELSHGSLLLMGGNTQLHWKHEVPRTTAPVGERINLTFRHVEPTPASTSA